MTDAEYYQLFAAFRERDEKLRAITRYSMYKTMLYRTNVYGHARRVMWLVEEMLPYLRAVWTDFNEEKARLMALIHDDFEIFLGDIQAGDKSKMTDEQLADVHRRELLSIDQVADLFPEFVGKYNYRALLKEIVTEETRETWVVKYADKMDGFGEALHEVFGGNYVFEIAVVNQYGAIPNATAYYVNYFSSFLNKFPEMKQVLAADVSWFAVPDRQPFGEIANQTKPHTIDSLHVPTGYPYYDVWKEIILKRGNEEDIKNLYVQKEYLPTTGRV